MADAKVQLKEIYPIPEAAKKKAWISGRDAYDKLWKRSVEEPEKFWAEIAEQQVTWFKKWDKVMDYNFDIKKGPIYVKFFEGGKTQRFLQLSRQTPRKTRQSGCDSVGRQRAGRRKSHNLQNAA